MSQIAAAPTCSNFETFAESLSIRMRPFELVWVAIGSGLIPLSLIWDFSWESSIGVDLFWSPPHVATHAGVFLSGLLGLYLVVRFSWLQRAGCDAGVRVGIFSSPAGGWFLLWGALVMLLALPLDKWWQTAYGLVAGLWPPPQILKTVSFFVILCGAWLLCVSHQNINRDSKLTAALVSWHGGLLLTMCGVVLITSNYPHWQHAAKFYKVSGAIYPAILLALAVSSKTHWGATRAAMVYTLIGCAAVWLLPLFPAQPLTAPIHNPITRMMPPPFPLLLVIPAVLIDLVVRKFWGQNIFPIKQGSSRLKSLLRQTTQFAAMGFAFLLAFLFAQWHFARFLLSEHADNWFFAGGGKHWPFFLKIDEARFMFWGTKEDPVTGSAVLIATILAAGSAWIGLTVGRWANHLRR